MSTNAADSLRTLHSPLEPYFTGHLQVSPIHKLYYELSGNPTAKQTAVVLHGGPGGGCAPWYRQFFNPADYRVVMFDQRGAGKSEPHANLEDNTTWHLVEDIEAIRKVVGVERWVVFGGAGGDCRYCPCAHTLLQALGEVPSLYLMQKRIPSV